jgi:DNA-binding transcriptional regulator YhcF (GntR family)
MSDRPADKLANTHLDGIAVDRGAEVPIGVQLAWILRSRIADSELVPGQRLPGLRDLAEATGVNVNTVRAVYQRLEREGLIDSQQGSGTFVASAPRRPSVAGTIAADAAREARETGVDPREVAAALYVGQGPSGVPGDEAAERRRLLRTQIAALERALGEMEATHPGLAPPPVQTRGGMGPALLGADELEQVRTLLVRRLSAVQSAIDACVEEATAPERKRAAGHARSRPSAEHNPAAEPGPAAEHRRAPRQRPTTARPAPAGT